MNKSASVSCLAPPSSHHLNHLNALNHLNHPHAHHAHQRVNLPPGQAPFHPHHHHHHHQPPPPTMLPFDTLGLYEPQPKPRFFFKMPRVVPDQKNKFESDELFRRLGRESEVRLSIIPQKNIPHPWLY